LLKCGVKLNPNKSAFHDYKNKFIVAETSRLQLKTIALTGQFENKIDRRLMVKRFFEMMCNLMEVSLNNRLDNTDICIYGIETLGDVFTLYKNHRSALIYYLHGV